MTEVWLIRHGESEANARGVIQGHYDSPLSERGQVQAHRLAERLALDPPDLLYTSDLSRARETARIIADVCSMGLRSEQRLREIEMGSWTNRPFDEILATMSREERERWERGDPHFRRGGAESLHELRERFVTIVDEIVQANEGQRVAIVSHGGAIGAYLAHLLRMPLNNIFHHFSLSNTSITRLRPPQANQPGRLLTYNDTCHLEPWTRPR
ncbi:MAG: histidine phosphatase family protein [Chloroflexota bacterium]|nr:histidine phosphatase family protein [Chloroflexota bacterium]